MLKIKLKEQKIAKRKNKKNIKVENIWKGKKIQRKRGYVIKQERINT